MFKYLILAVCLIGCTVAQAAEDPMALGKSNEGGLSANPQGIRGKYNSWSQTGTLITRNTALGIRMSQTFFETGTYTVSFNIGQAAGATSPTAIADITFGIHGTVVRRQITVIDGSSISMPCESVEVTLRDANLAGTAGLQYAGTITIAKGTRGNFKQPPFLYLGTLEIDPGNNASIVVPQDIGASSVMVRAGNINPPLTSPIPRGSVGITQGGLSALPSGVYDPRDYDWVPVVPGIQSVQAFVDIGLVGPVRFEVYMGIDG